MELVKTFNFADDKKVACIIENRFDGIKLQNAIDKFIDWCDGNGLEVNSEKCKIISFTRTRTTTLIDYRIKGKTIDRVNNIRDLGVMMDQKLDFHSHIEYAKKKAEMALGFVKRQCRNKLGKEVSTLLYSSLVRSNLEFASTVWMPYTKEMEGSIESVQKQAVIFINEDYLNQTGELCFAKLFGSLRIFGTKHTN